VAKCKLRSDTTKIATLDASGIEKHIGNTCGTKGFVSKSEHLRFDFSHFAKVTDEELHQVEDFVNAKFRSNCH
jgi:alanyl-tRNA synthetase